MEVFFKHVVESPVRWDVLAYLYAGDSSLMPELLKDNIHVSHKEILEIGDFVFIREEYIAEKQNNSTAPWL